MILGRSVSLVKLGLFLVAVSVAATGCRDHLYQFRTIAEGDAGMIDARGRTDGTVSNPDLHFASGGTVGRDGGTGGIGGGTGGRAGATGTGGIATCNPNSPELQTDTANCGTCFHQCIVPNATPSCVAGTCKFTCQTGFFDADKDPANGCECTKTNGGVEICDGLDNDCNGAIDDGFDFQGDVKNCGGCNHQCAFPFATATCVSGVCTQGACLPELLRPRSHRAGLRDGVHQDQRRRRDLRRPRQRLRRHRRRQPRRADGRLPHQGRLRGNAADLLRTERLGLQLPGDVRGNRGHQVRLRHPRQRLQRPDRRALPDRQVLHLRQRPLRGNRHLGLRQRAARQPHLHGDDEAAGRRDLRRHRQRLRRVGGRAQLGLEPDDRRRARPLQVGHRWT